MALPHSREARVFYQAAKQRMEDARFLLEGERNTATVYLAGYAIECMLKSLILSCVPESGSTEILASFHGARAHDVEWLKKEYMDRGGAPVPAAIARSFGQVNTWATELRYKPGTMKRRDVVAFVDAAAKIMEWADGRL